MGRWSSALTGNAAPAVLVVGALALVHFFPFFLGSHMVPFHFLPSWESGLAAGKPIPPAAARLLAVRFPGTDESPVALHYPSAFFTGACLRSGELPLWNPHVGCGLPALACGQSYPFSPFLVPFYAHPTPWVYTLGLVLGTLFSAAGAWFWLRRFAFGPWVTAFAAGLWAFNPWTLRMTVFSSVWAAWWFGWLLWSWDAFLEAPLRRAWRPAIAVAGMVCCGHPETAVLLAGASLLYLCLTWTFAAWGERPPAGRLVAGIAAAVALAGLLTAVQWLPVVAHLGESVSYKQGSAAAGAAVRYDWGEALSPRSEIYLSPVLVGLCAAGAAGLRRNRALWPTALLFTASLLLTVDAGGLGTLMGRVPLLGLVPLKYFCALLWLSLVPLAAAGLRQMLDAVRGGDRRPMARAVAFALGVPLVWGVLFLLAGYASPRGLFAPILAAGTLLWILLALSTGGVVRRAAPALAALAVLLVLVEPAALQPFSYFNRMDPASDPKLPALEKVLAEDPAGHGRFHGDFPWPMVVTPDLAALWGARDVRVNEVLQLERYARFNRVCSPANQKYVGTWVPLADLPPGLAAAMGVRARFTVGPVDVPLIAKAVPRPSARAFLVAHVLTAHDERRSEELLAAGLAAADWRTEAILESPSGLPAPFQGLEHGAAVAEEAGRVEWVEDRAAEVVLQVDSPQPALLVLMDTYAAGWKASVDGVAAAIHPADLAFRGVLVPAGSHLVRMVYRPWSVGAGAALSGSSWLALAGLWVVRRRRATAPSTSGAPRGA